MKKPRRLRGYTLVALLIGITTMTIMIAAILPLASTQRQREDEEELIFRGTQYAEGIRIFRRKYGRYPTSLKEMLDTKPRTIRKLWQDPILRSDDWGLVTLTQGGAVGLIPTPVPGRGGTGGAVRAPTPAPSPTPDHFRSTGDAAGPVASVGPILGVYSKSKKEGLRTFQGRKVYEEWKFTENTVGQGAGVTPGAGVRDGPSTLPPGGGGGKK